MGDVRPSQFIVTPTGYDDMVNSDRYIWTLTIDVVDSEQDRWAVKQRGFRLSRSTSEFDYEPLPSSRESDWIADHSFTLDEAKAAALELVDDVVVNGLTAQEASDWVAAHQLGRS